MSGTQLKSFIHEIEADQLIQEERYEDAITVILNTLQSSNHPNREIMVNQLAICYLKLNQFSKAIEKLQEALELNPENTTVLYHLGLSYFSKTDYASAIPYFEKLIQIEGYSTDNLYHLGFSLLYTNHSEEALNYFKELIDQNNLKAIQPELIYEIGIQMIRAKQITSAKDFFVHYLAVAENDIDATFGLGIAYSELSDYHRSLECFSRVFKWDHQRFPSIQVMIGVAQYKIGNIQPALDALHRAIDQNHYEYEARYYLGMIYDELNLPSKSIYYLKEAANINRKSVETLEKLGSVYLKTEQYEEARMTYKKLLKITGRGGYAYQIATLYSLKEDYKQALKYYTLANAENSVENINYNIGICYFNLQQFSQAIPYLESSLTSNQDEWVFFMIGSAYLKIEQYDIALENLYKAHQLNANHLPTLYNIGILFANRAKYYDADLWFDKYLVLAENTDVLYAKALTSFKLGHTQSSITFFTKTMNSIQDNTEVLYKIALYLIQLKATQEAVLCLEKVLLLLPNHQKAKDYLKELKRL